MEKKIKFQKCFENLCYLRLANLKECTRRTSRRKISTVDHLKCCFCKAELSLPDSFQIHMLNNSVTCHNCSCTITPENLYVAAFLRRHASGFYGMLLTLDTNQYTWVALTSKISNLIKSYGSILSTSRRKLYKGFVENAKGNLSNVSLDLVKGMYRQLDFINKICVNFQYWNDEAIISASIARYFKFMQLMKTFGKKKMLVPTMDIDLVWHTHQTYSHDYIQCCNRHIHRVIDHDDTIPGEDLHKGYTRTFISWSRAYHEAYSSHPPDYTAWRRNHTSFCSLFGLYREILWIRHSSTVRPGQQIPVAVSVPAAEESRTVVKPVCVVATPVYDSTYRPDNNLTTIIAPVMAVSYYDNGTNGNNRQQNGCGGGGCGLSGCAGVGRGCGGGCGGGGGVGCGAGCGGCGAGCGGCGGA